MERMANELSELRGELCRSTTDFCRVCFEGSTHRCKQNPPNVFRIARRQSPHLFFIFDKPNDNDAFRTSDAVPISVFDPRPIFGPQPSYANLLRLLELVGLAAGTPGQDPLAVGRVHVTNAVKCDKCAVTGKTGRVEINERQVKACVDRFLLKELSILRPKALVFFGKAPQKYVCGYTTDPWMCTEAVVGDRSYWMMRVPHPSPTSYNTHGGLGAAYIEPFKTLKVRAGIQ
jgi:hypothetical protein